MENKCHFSSFISDYSTQDRKVYMYGLDGINHGALTDGGGAYTVAADGIEFMAYRNSIVVRTNREQKNVINKNIFFFTLGENKLVPYIYTFAKAENINDYLSGFKYGPGIITATDWVLLHSNLDYMRCPSKVGINGPYSCK